METLIHVVMTHGGGFKNPAALACSEYIYIIDLNAPHHHRYNRRADSSAILKTDLCVTFPAHLQILYRKMHNNAPLYFLDFYLSKQHQSAGSHCRSMSKHYFGLVWTFSLTISYPKMTCASIWYFLLFIFQLTWLIARLERWPLRSAGTPLQLIAIEKWHSSGSFPLPSSGNPNPHFKTYCFFFCATTDNCQAHLCCLSQTEQHF